MLSGQWKQTISLPIDKTLKENTQKVKLTLTPIKFRTELQERQRAFWLWQIELIRGHLRRSVLVIIKNRFQKESS